MTAMIEICQGHDSHSVSLCIVFSPFVTNGKYAALIHFVAIGCAALFYSRANLQSEDNFRWTPLHFACHSGMYDVIEYLVEKGANIDAVTMNGATPFMRAIESSKPEIVQYLLEKGVKVQTETRKGHLRSFSVCLFLYVFLAKNH